jgi:hypothetical protein
MKRMLVMLLAIIMVFSAIPAVGAYAAEAEVAEKAAPEMMAKEKVLVTTRDITNASIAWVKQATGALIWAPADDTRSDDEIIAQAKAVDSSLTGGTDIFAVMKGFGTAATPNTNGSKASVNVALKDESIIMTITGKFSHFDFVAKQDQPADPADPTEPAQPAEEGEKANIRIDAPLKMAVAFEDGTVYYGGEMKEVIVGKEYAFQMCSVNWENGQYDGADNGLTGTVVYRMEVVHRNEFNELAKAAKEDPDRYTVKGIDIIDNVGKKIIVNIDASDTHLETDVNNFFMAYRFHFDGQDYNKKTGIDKVVNTPLESLSVNLPLGSTITCKAFNGDEQIDTADVLVMNNSGKGIYEDEYLTSVNDFTWGQDQLIPAVEIAPVIEYAK